MRLRNAAVLAAVLALPLAACNNTGYGGAGSMTSSKQSYTINKPVTALVIGARAASVTVTTGDGPVTVTEQHRYSDNKPTTSHQVQGTTLRLTESGCGNDNVRCETHYTIRMPRTMSADITAQAGAVDLTGLSGDVRVSTQAGAVQAENLSSKQVTVQTQAGAASLKFAEPPMNVRTTTKLGAIEVGLPGTTAYAVDVHNGAGTKSVKVDQDSSSKHHVSVRTQAGAVEISRS
jgi:DUF4097 and DUF4098 domain-containing protein YvlB